MPITPEQVDQWRHAPSEHERLEFKEAKTQFDSARLCEYCVTLANEERGGHLILGVANQPPRPVVGTQACRNPSGMAGDLLNMLGFRVEIEEVYHPDGRMDAVDSKLIRAEDSGSGSKAYSRYVPFGA